MTDADPFVATLHRWMEVSMHRSMNNFIRFTRENGLSMSQIGALFHLHHKERAGVTDLGDHLGVTSAAASQMLERLVQQELIQRSEDPSDRRVKQIVMTDKGCQVLEAGIRARQGWFDELEKTLSGSEKEQVIMAFNILIEKANQLGKPEEPES